MSSWIFPTGFNQYRIQRQIDSQGRLVSARLDQVIKDEKRTKTLVGNDQKYRPVISGERKQLGESVINEVENTLGIDYTKLQIAAIIQQGEISKIIDSQPKEFKELLNNMIGLDRLDKSYFHMHEIIEDFRGVLRSKTGGYDDKHINILSMKIKENENKILESGNLLGDVLIEVSNLTKELNELDMQIENMEPKIAKLTELKSLENTLLNYVKELSISWRLKSKNWKR